MKYRSELDGLRAVSVVAVVLFHAGTASFSGGYVGVDIFFVISGYLITTLILQEQAAGKFSFLNFYERRIRRLMPALVVMLLIVTPLCMWLLLPDELIAYGQNLYETLAFVLNIFLWRDIGYFTMSAAQRPLIHLWSLSVEEQFYLVWPLLLWYLDRRVSLPALRWIVLAIIAVSLAVSQWAAVNAPGGAYYLTPSRAWEPMLGALVALLPVGSTSRPTREGAGIAGLLMIAAAVVSFGKSTVFPGLNALLPCGGAALVIYAGIHGRTLAATILSWRPLVALGKISYSVYLWHWPLIALSLLYLGRTLHVAEVLGLAGASIVLGALSWRFAEQPYRRKAGPGAAGRFWPRIAAGVAAVACAALFIVTTGGLPNRVPAAQLAAFKASQSLAPIQSRCDLDGHKQIPPAPMCLFGPPRADGRYDTVLWGDSHARVLQPAIAQIATQRGLRVRQMTFSDCPPLARTTITYFRAGANAKATCEHFNDQVLDIILHTPGIRTVYMTARWAFYKVSGTAWPAKAGADLFTAALQGTVTDLTKHGVTVYLIAQTPELGVDAARCTLRETLLNRPLTCLSVNMAKAIAPIAAVNRIITHLAQSRAEVHAIDPNTTLCGKAACPTAGHGHFYYLDSNHLSRAGAQLAARALR